MNQEQEAYLQRGFTQRQTDAFTYLFDRYTSDFRQVPGLEDPDQLAFDKALATIQKYGIEDRDLLERIVPTIIRNALIDEQRKQIRSHVVEWPYSDIEEDISDRYVSFGHSPSPEEIVVQQESLNEMVERVINQIPEKLRVPTVYTALGYSQEEISTELGIPVGTTKSRVNRGRIAARKLRDSLVYHNNDSHTDVEE